MKKKQFRLTSLSIAVLLAYSGLHAQVAQADSGFSILSPEPQARATHLDNDDTKAKTQTSEQSSGGGFFSFFKRTTETDTRKASDTNEVSHDENNDKSSVATTAASKPIENNTEPTPTTIAAVVPSTVNLSPLPIVEVKEPLALASSIDLTIPTDDLWERMRQGYAIPELHSDLVLYHQQRYMNQPEYLRRIVERSRRYIYHILAQLEERGMPTELALLPMVESAYNPMAASPARAVGLWQFIPSTGKNFKLEQNWWMDQRRDIVASTSAALDYLQYVYDMHGDWQLALASYNWGEGAVARAIGKNRTQGLPTDYLSLSMPSETRNYVPKLQALKNIFSNPKLIAELDLPETPNRPYFSTIAAPGNIDIKLAAKLANVPMEEFIALNPAHNRPIIKGNVELALPSDKIETFKANLDNHDQPLSSWRVYSVKPGERLDKIASRFNISLASLKSANGIDKKTKIKPGLTLLVPASGGEVISDLSMLRLPSADLTPEKSTGGNGKIARNNSSHYQIQKGDTLATVAKKNNVSVSDLKRWNDLKSDRLKAGTRLALSTPDTSTNNSTNSSKKQVTAQPDTKKQIAQAALRNKASENRENRKLAAKTTNTRNGKKATQKIATSSKPERTTRIARNN